MSLNGILNTAVSGLQANQTALRTTSTNIANVNTEGYQRREVQFGPRLTASTLTGVRIEEIRRIADQYLSQESISATGLASKADTLTSFFSRVQQLVASLNGDSSLQARVQTAMTAISKLTTDPSSAATRASAVSAVQSALSSISAMASGVQALRQDANTQLTQGIATVNDLVSRVYDLNTQIKRAFQMGDTS